MGFGLTDIFTGGSGLLGDAVSMWYNHKEAKENRRWQEYMSGTAHRREVNDLRAAGLNPVLSAGGKGAPMGSGSSASIDNLSTGINQGISNAIAARTAKANINAIETKTSMQKMDMQMQKDMMSLYESDENLRKQVLRQMLESKTGSRLPDAYKLSNIMDRINSAFRRMTDNFYDSFLDKMNERRKYEDRPTGPPRNLERKEPKEPDWDQIMRNHYKITGQ